MTNLPLVTKVYCIEDMFVNTFFRFSSITFLLYKNNISYRIEYEETTDEENNTVIKQSIRASKKIENTEIITITVARNTNNNSDTDNNETNNEETDNNNKEDESSNQDQEKNLQN